MVVSVSHWDISEFFPSNCTDVVSKTMSQPCTYHSKCSQSVLKRTEH